MACSSEPDAPLLAGEAQYLQYCSSCHGRDGEGRSSSFPPLKGSEWLAAGPDAIVLIITQGLRGPIEVAGKTYRGYMPPMRHVDDREIAAVLEFIGQQWADWPEPVDPARVGQLRQQFDAAGVIEGRAGLDPLLEKVNP
ncbi:MAG: cytochrome c [Xanthomonadaceae bacterium]|nr:cytochrome c [Xanthomonadaceae bacterium]